MPEDPKNPEQQTPDHAWSVPPTVILPMRTSQPMYIPDPYFPPGGVIPVPATWSADPTVTSPGQPLHTVPAGTRLSDNPTELVKHQFLIYESDLVDVVVDEINFPSQAITRLIRSKLATICSDIDRYHWRAYASRLDYAAITITAYGTPK
jgi:hypothetical protein